MQAGGAGETFALRGQVARFQKNREALEPRWGRDTLPEGKLVPGDQTYQALWSTPGNVVLPEARAGRPSVRPPGGEVRWGEDLAAV